MNVADIGNRIKKRRTALEMTQKELAGKMNVSSQLISKWETGESIPSLEYLDAMCKVLDVDYSYFTSDGENEKEPTDKTPKQRKLKRNLNLFIIIACSILAAAFIAGFTLLTIFVFVPAANRTRYIDEIEKAYEKYFDLGYYSVNEKSELDGDIKDDYRYDGYLDENGDPVFYDTKYNITVKDGILTYGDGEHKYRYESDKTYQTVEELAIDRIISDDSDYDLWNDNFIDIIRYIRKVDGGYYLEFKDEYFFDELSGTQKKNFKLTEKIKGKIEIKDGLYNYMEVTVKFLNRPDNERFTVKASYEFIAERPVIEHKNLEGREWYGTYVGDKWYPPASPDLPDSNNDPICNDPICEDLLSADEFVSLLSGDTANKLKTDYAFNSLILDGQLNDGGDCYYYFDGTNVKIYDKNNLSLKTTVELGDDVSDVYVYSGNVYWQGYNRYFRIKNIATGQEEALFRILTGNMLAYNGNYAIYYNFENTTDTYGLIDLTKKQIAYSYSEISFRYLDSAGNFYGQETIDGEYVPVVYKNGSRTVLKGKDFYGVDSKLYTDGDSVFTNENSTVYRYEKGVLKEQLTTANPRFKKNYINLSNGYCIAGTSGGVYDENDVKREFGRFKLKTASGEWQTISEYTYKEILAVINGKIIVSTDFFGGYILVFDENDLTKPLYYTQQPTAYEHPTTLKEIEIRRIGTNTVIAVRVNSVDAFGYELYYL